MFKLRKIILVLALLLVMPLQGMATALSHALCTTPSVNEQMGLSHHPDTGGTGDIFHEPAGNDTSVDHTGHLSCHQSSSGIPSITVLAFANDLPVYHPSNFSSPRLFFPEQPQRPPRA